MTDEHEPLDEGRDEGPEREDARPENPQVEDAQVEDAQVHDAQVEDAWVEDAESVYWAEEPVVDAGIPEATVSESAVDDETTDASDPESAEDSGEAVAGADSGEGLQADPLGAPLEVDMGPERRSRWWIWAAVGVAVMLVAGGATYGWWWMTARQIVVPDLIGKQAADATQTLNDVDLTLGKVSEAPTDVAPVGTIIAQTPEAGSRLKPEATVSFVLAAAPEQAKVPNVVGLGIEDASVLLAKARLRPQQVASFSTTVAAGFVIAQVPPNGAELMPGNPVALAVSKGPAPGNTTVPPITGLAEGDAVALLSARGLTARVYQSLDPSIGAGVVVTQTPLPNTSIAPGANVQVLVSKGFGSGTVAVPDVVNDPRKPALDAIKAAGLKAAAVFQFHPTVARGTVISQMPFAGRRVQSGDSVGVLISRGPVTTALVPSIVGSSSAEATAAVTDAGFKAVVVEVEMPGRDVGTVVGQFPAPAASYELRYPVICLVAKEIEP